MEKREETTEEIQRKRRRQILLSFPLDLTSEILSKLPAKYVLRFSCVSKLWSSITTDPYFNKSFQTQSSTRPSLLVCFRRGATLFVFSIPQHHQKEPHSSSRHVDIYHTAFPKNCCFSFTESVNGLICFRNRKLAKPVIWNPTMRKFSTLPKPEKTWKDITVFPGYDPIKGKHKLVCMPRKKTCDEIRVLTLGSAKESWRSIKTNHKHCPLTSRHGRCINGVLYYEASLPEHTDIPIVMSFDVKSEKFSMIQLPSNLDIIVGAKLIPYKGRLAYVRQINNSIKLWVLEDAEKHEWSFKHFAVCTYYDWRKYVFSELAGTTSWYD
ncbi:putative F-box protein At1g50870 [Eutrema salsugineum]|uniref:putative F-box protein At1g50870 n=1 Tax=Eutrema salsugineum TaxID=72664 RepID=UPI000CED332E|nr:putative F-box protein At1g50870 [Eutrema salsugineum]